MSRRDLLCMSCMSLQSLYSLTLVRQRAKGTSVITASIVGATGYTGAVLTDILAEHPRSGSGP